MRLQPQPRKWLSTRPAGAGRAAAQQAAVLLTNDIYEYALAAAAVRQVAVMRGLSSCHPVALPVGARGRLGRSLNHYDLACLSFTSIVGEGDLTRRSRTLRTSLFPHDVPPVAVDPDWVPGRLAAALFLAIVAGRPLVFDASARSMDPLDQLPPSVAGRDGHWVLAKAESLLAIPAALYAARTGKRFVVLDGDDTFGSALQQREYQTAILVDEHEAFDKAVLHEFRSAVPHSTPGALPPGILTACSAWQLSDLVWRSLAHRDFRAGGSRLAEPAGVEPVSLRSTGPLEYYILSGHGDELHIDHGEDEVICGSFSSSERAADELPFGCEQSCHYPGAIRATDVPVATIILLSCDSATFGDGFAPRGYSVLLNLLDGWCTSAIAPYKHAMLAPELHLLADALVRSGYCLGEIVERLNTVARTGTAPDAPFIVVGDPEVVPSPTRRWKPVPAQCREQTDSIVIASYSGGGQTLDCVIPQEHVDALGPPGTRLAVEPVSAELAAGDLRFVLRRPIAADGLGVVVFGPDALPADLLRFRLRRASVPDAPEQGKVRRSLDNLHKLCAFGLDPTFLGKVAQGTAALLDSFFGYPQVAEHILRHTLLRHYAVVRDSATREARLAVLRRLVESMARRSLWISHVYGAHYATAERLAGHDGTDMCPYCGNPTVSWRYLDGALGLAPRGPEVCPRCGIVSDIPYPAALKASFDVAPPLTGTDAQRRLTVRNVSSTPREVSLVAQFNEWLAQGIEVDPEVATLCLAPGQTSDCIFRFSFRRPLHEDLNNLHAFALTDEFELYCFTQRTLAHSRSAAAVNGHYKEWEESWTTDRRAQGS